MSGVLNAPINSIDHRAFSPVPPCSAHRAEATAPASEEAAAAREAGPASEEVVTVREADPASTVNEAAAVDHRVLRAVAAGVAGKAEEEAVVAARKPSTPNERYSPVHEFQLRDLACSASIKTGKGRPSGSAHSFWAPKRPARSASNVKSTPAGNGGGPSTRPPDGSG